MIIDFDPKKSNKNASDRGLPFHRVVDFDWETAIYTAYSGRDKGY